MKTTFGIGALCALSFFLAGSGFARTEGTERIEVPVGAVFIPERGFDDNDHVVMVVAGELPHACYTLGETKLERDGRRLRVHQYAWLRRTGICAGELDPDATAPFEVEVAVGQLDAGHYDVQFLRDGDKVGSRSFAVAVAATVDIDDYAYAPVTEVVTPTVALDDESVEITLRGSFGRSCERLEDRVRIERQGNVFVVLPVVELTPGMPCTRAPTRFSRRLKLGHPGRGRYLVHVRAASGRAVNRLFSVM